MNKNIKRGIVGGAISLSLLGGSAAGVVAAPHGTGADTVTTAQTQRAGVGQLVRGLVNVNVGAVQVNISGITVQDVIDVENVLNNNQIRVLNNLLNNNEVASRNQDVLNNLLRGANLITNNQVVVGVLSGPTFVIQTLPV